MQFPYRSASLALVLSALLGACATRPGAPFQREAFELGDTYSRVFKTTEAQACEAARRALLSQGYVVSAANADLVNARQSFQNDADTHLEIEFRVVCSPEVKGGDKTLVFVSALQERFALKKNNNSASLGVGAIGSVSLPFGGSDDSLVKVASETITAADFYDRYFRLVTRYLAIASSEAGSDKP